MTELELPWRDLFTHSPVAMSVIDPYGRQLAGNRAYAELFGYTEDELAALDVGRLTFDEDRAWTASYLTRLLSGELDRFVTEKRYRHRDGSVILARLTATALHDEHGVSYGSLGIIEPVVAAQRADDARLRRFLEFSEPMFLLLDGQGGVIEASGRYRSVLGYPSEYWEKRSVFEMLAPGETEKALAFRQWLHEHPGTPASSELLVRAADGRLEAVRATGVNLLDDPEIQGIIVTTNNITEERRRMAELSERGDTAEASVRAQLELLARVSHELRNPLHVVQGLAELLASEPLPDAAADLARRLHRQVSGLADITQDLLDAAGLATGAVHLRVGSVDVHELVGEIVDFGRVAVDDRPVVVDAVVESDVPAWIEGDVFRLRQILRNLVGNAVKFTERGTVHVSLRRAASGDLVIEVTDTGVGIPPEEINRVLEPFRTASTAGVARGAGLGLSIVHHLASALGGQLHIESTPGVGSTFAVTLPLIAAPTPFLEVSEESVSSPSGITVLVVEDNLVNQQLAISQLERLGMDAVVVDSGEAALDFLTTSGHRAVDVVLMDYLLPGMDGLETTKAIRRLPDDSAFLPVVGLTASASVQHRDTFRASGLDSFLAKPASIEDLRQAISDAIGLARLAADAPTLPIAPADAADVDGAPVAERRDSAVDGWVLDRLVSEFDSRSTVCGLIESYLRELTGRVDAILHALAAGDETAASRAAHTLKSGSQLLGAGRLADMCLAIERGEPSDSTGFRLAADEARSELMTWVAQVP